CCGRREQGARRPDCVLTKFCRRNCRAVRKLSGHAQFENPAVADGTALFKRDRNCALAGGPTASEKGQLPRPEIASATRPRSTANARLRRHSDNRSEDRSRWDEAFFGKYPPIFFGGKLGRGREPDQSSPSTDACVGCEGTT